MAVSAREQAIIALWEADHTPKQIADELGLGLPYVSQRISDLCLNVGLDRNHDRAMREGSRMLRDAIRQARAPLANA